MDAHGLWAKVKATTEPRTKARLIFAMSIRSILLVSFAVVFIGGLSAVFGPDNSGLAVAGFCILLGIKHVPYGYRATDSVIALAFVLAAMVCGGLAAQAWPPVPCLMVNFLLITVILILVADEPLTVSYTHLTLPTKRT